MDDISRQAFENLKDLSKLASADLEEAMGGPLTPAALRSIRNWLARAFEAGQAYGTTKADPHVRPTPLAPKPEGNEIE